MFFKKVFNIITIEENIIILPINEIKQDVRSGKRLIRICNKLNKILKHNSSKVVAISEKLSESSLFKNQIYKENIHILDGRWLFNYLCNETVEYIANMSNKQLENVEITILANYIDDVLENNLLELAQRTKQINIVTNNIEKFIKISEYLQENYGIIIRVSKNRRKGLLKAEMVINYDFTEDMVNKCKLNPKTILINLNEKVHINWKAFSGININFFSIEVKEEITNFFESLNLDKSFSKEILYESIIFKKGNYESVKKMLKNDEVRIKQLVGINGFIDKNEYLI